MAPSVPRKFRPLARPAQPNAEFFHHPDPFGQKTKIPQRAEVTPNPYSVDPLETNPHSSTTVGRVRQSRLSSSTARATSTRSPIRSSDPGSRVGILPKSRKGAQDPQSGALELPKIPPPTLLSADQILIMNRLAKVLDEDPEVLKAGVTIVQRMIDEEKVHHLHAAEEEAGRHADRDRKKVIKKDKRSVFGVNLRTVQHYASLMFLLGDTQPHRIPTVVCVVLEQLFHRICEGSFDNSMFTPLPPTLSGPVRGLVDFFSLAPKFGDDDPTPVKTASAKDLSHLLLYFLQSLPDPALDSSIFHILVNMCALPSTHAAQVNQEQCSVRTERYRIQVAKLALRLLPNSQFALLVHLLAFFSHMPRYGITLVQVADAFGPAICCPRDGLTYLRGEGVFAEDKITLERTLEHGSQEYVAKISKELLLWLLLYWDHIADGLLEDEFEDDLKKFVAECEDINDGEDEDRNFSSAMDQPVPHLPGRRVSPILIFATPSPPSSSSPSISSSELNVPASSSSSPSADLRLRDFLGQRMTPSLEYADRFFAPEMQAEHVDAQQILHHVVNHNGSEVRTISSQQPTHTANLEETVKAVEKSVLERISRVERERDEALSQLENLKRKIARLVQE